MRFAAALTLVALCVPAWAARAGESEADGQFFETRVRPVLAERCYSCHSATAPKLKGKLSADSRAGLLRGGESGPAIVPGHPEQSRLVAAIDYHDPDLQMPPKGKLPEAQIADLGEWVRRGAPWPEAGGVAGAAAPPPGAPATPAGAFDLAGRKASHWAWRPIRPQSPPAVRDRAWPASPLDHFVLAQLEEKGLRPAPPADRRALLRRVCFDLTGLPPSPAEVEAFLADASPDAFAKVVDRLLASEHFGERWARHWLDVVRYAETRGHEFDYPIPNAWQYRDYVARAFNADLPYDQFVTEQIAGDLLDHPRLHPTRGFNESILGTGFWFLGEEVHSPVDIRQDEADRMNSRLDTLTKAFSGLTVGCARCHDHKFDALSARDHYALTGVLLGGSYRQAPFESMEHNRAVAGRLNDLRQRLRPALLKAAAGACRPGVGRVADYLLAAREALAGKPPPADPAAAPALDSQTLGRWVEALRSAANDPRDPLYPFAKAATASDAGAGGSAATIIDGWTSRADRPAPPPAQVIADYARPGVGWWQDGFTFGIGPARPGELDLSAGREPALAVPGLVTRGAARRDPAWPDVRAVGSETDAGTLGTFGRPGRTFRTPKVTLRTGQIWFLMRGAAHVYAAVDSHLMVNGPLHGGLLKTVGAGKGVKAGASRWEWVRHDLSAYAGQRVEIEFTPAGAGALEVAEVIEAEGPPPAETPSGRLVAALSDPAARSPEGMARAYQALFADVLDRLEADAIVGSPDAADVAPLADWLLRHADGFAPPDAPARAALGAALGDARAREAELIAQVQTQSHTAPAMLDGNGVDESVLIRGVAKNAGPVVPRRYLEAVAGPDQPPYPRDASGRRQLAEALLRPDDPFTARVMANRVWQHLFGVGLVATVDNFGALGQPPTHPQLLDALADEFRGRDGWSVKKLIRSIVLSRAYQMSSLPDPATARAAEQCDPRNLLLHHMPVRRLEAEAIRDAILAVSGRLDGAVGGPSVEVYLTPFMEGRGKPASGPLDGAGRRSLYVKVRRNFLSPMMLAFDTPIPFATVGRRSVSNVPAQALILMNDPFVVRQAAAWAKRVLAGARGEDERITGMYLDAFARPPTARERAAAREFLEQTRAAGGEESAWADFAHVLFNTKEFIFIR